VDFLGQVLVRRKIGSGTFDQFSMTFGSSLRLCSDEKSRDETKDCRSSMPRTSGIEAETCTPFLHPLDSIRNASSAWPNEARHPVQ
jgi:hypothetical protein